MDREQTAVVRIVASSSSAPYAFAAAATLAAFAARLAMARYFGPPYLLFYPTVLLTSLVGGLGPGLLSTAMAAGLAARWVLPAPLDTTDAVSLAVFTTMGVFTSVVAHAYRRTRQRERAYLLDRAALECEERSLRREAETLRQLEVREHHLRTVLETALDGFWVANERGEIVDVNGAACAMVGYSREELLRMRVWELDADETPAAGEARREAIRRDGCARFEARHRRKDGTVIDVDVSVRKTDLDGPRFVSFARDVTAARHAREALVRSEQRFRALIEKSSDMILVIDAEGRYLFSSEGSTETLGWSPEEKLGRLALDFVHPDDRERLGAVLRRLLDRPDAPARELVRVQHKNGSWRTIEATARNLLRDPAVGGIVINARDVTEQRQLEEQFWQAQKLESVGRLAGGVAHDFNNLLTVILSGVEELRLEPSVATAGVEEIVEEVQAAGERARDLTRQLLAFARKQAIQPESLDVAAVVRGSEKLLGRLLGEDIELVTRSEQGLWPVRCDRGQLEQVIVNLAVNARDAMPAGGRLSIEASNLELDVAAAAARPGARPGAYVRLAVQDSGTGMAPEVKARIFEPFFTTKAIGKGTGLGLSTVYGIVQQSDGAVSVESAPGSGTTFELLFPRATSAVEQASPPVAPASTRGTEVVLVVEDDPHVRAVTVRALESGGYRVLVAGDGREAIAVAAGAEGSLRLVVTDVVMPGASGQAVADALRERHPGVRVLFVSGYTRDAITERGVPCSRAELLQKPFTPVALLAKVRAVLDAP